MQAIPNMPASGDQFHYVVALDREDDGTGIRCTAEEVELDVEELASREEQGATGNRGVRMRPRGQMDEEEIEVR